MKIRIEFDTALAETEVIIKAPCLNEEVERLQKTLTQAGTSALAFYKADSQYFIKLSDVLFFETDGTKIFAHTRDDAYEVKHKLYELEALLPSYFCRVAKAAIVNMEAIYSLDKSFSGTSTVSFSHSHKQVHVSRHYYQILKERLSETR